MVESPAKARTISRLLGPGFVVEPSIGHVRDLPRGAEDVPAKLRDQKWTRLGVDVENGFEPLYVVSKDRKQQVAKLRKLVKESDELLLATDEDREGEAIAWHVLELLNPKVPVRRMVFHEITPSAIAEAVANPRELDRDLVKAQETRRILDRLYGYEVSPVLWKKVQPRLSAGRVQSVATRLVVDRERARRRFVAAEYWSLSAQFALDPAEVRPGDPEGLRASLAVLDGRRVARSGDFDAETGRVKASREGAGGAGGVLVLDGETAGALAGRLDGAAGRVSSVERKPYTRKPYPPFMTSTLQQEAGRKLRFSAERTMRTAQRLYENGYITYMRTDSVHLSEVAVAAARAAARELYGPEYVADAARAYTRKVKNAQEAHEAIRPAGERFRTPADVAAEVGEDERRLYELVWQRTVACQMADAKGQTVSVKIDAQSAIGEQAQFTASGRTISFPGFLRAYVESTDEVAEGERAETDDSERRLPNLAEGQPLTARELQAEGHATTPPARYTEATLVRKLEELGIGRPSTYASILQTIQDRGYVWKKGTALVPTWTAFAVVGLLEQHFSRLVDYTFTADVENELDAIASGDVQSVEWLTRFYFGDGAGEPASGGEPADGSGPAGRELGLKELVATRLAEIDARGVNAIQLHTDTDGTPVVVRVGRYGPYVQRGEDGARASIPEDLPPDELTREKVEQLLNAPGERVLGEDPGTGRPVVVRSGRYGPYVTLGASAEEEQAAAEAAQAATKAKGAKKPAAPKAPTASLFRSMSPETVTLQEALELLSLPRTVGTDPADDGEITATNGRYGPYVRKGSEYRSLPSEEAILTVTLEAALALLAQPKARRGAASAPLRELGEDPGSGRPVVVKSGRFGPYVTDGEINATLRKADNPETVTLERAVELIAEKRAKGPAPKRRTTRKSSA